MSKIADAIRETGWETKLTVGLISMAAFIEASDAALKDAPRVRSHLPDFGLGSIWPYVPAILVALAALVWLYKTIWGLPKASIEPVNDAPLTRVEGQSYRHAVVPLDGYEYINCTFASCNFSYEGAPTRITACHFEEGHVTITANDPRIQNTLNLMKTFLAISDGKPPEIGTYIKPETFRKK